MQNAINPFFQGAVTSAAPAATPRTVLVKLPVAPVTGSPVPHLTSLYHNAEAGPYGSRSYPGNCSGNLIKDLLRFYGARNCFDPFLGSGTARDVCKELEIPFTGLDIRYGHDACSPSSYPQNKRFEFIWSHPPYWRQKVYTSDPRDLSQQPTLKAFLERYQRFIENCAGMMDDGGKFAVLMGDYSDRDAGFVPLTFWTKYIAFRAGLRQCATDIIRFSHGASSARKVYRSAFIPGLHDVCMIFERSTT